MYYVSEGVVEEIQERIGRVSRSGQFILAEQTDEFESGLDAALFSDHGRQSLLVSNGTVAIEVVLRALAATSSNTRKNVVIPALTLPLIQYAIERAGFTPVALDVEPCSHSLSPTAVQKYLEFCDQGMVPYPFGVFFVYTGGLIPPDIGRMVKACRERNVLFIEDVSHAYRTERRIDGWRPGTVGEAACGSLFATKVLSIGEGGLCRFQNGTTYRVAKIIRHNGKDENDKEVSWGGNYRASEFAAAIGNVKLKYLEKEIEHRKRIVEEVYRPWIERKAEFFRDPHEFLDIQHSYYKYIVQFRRGSAVEGRAEGWEEVLRNAGVKMSGAVHRSILRQGVLGFVGAYWVKHNHICLPLSSMEDAQKAVTELDALCK